MTQYHPSLAEAVQLALPRYSVPLFGPLAPFGRYFNRDALMIPSPSYARRIAVEYNRELKRRAAQAAR